MKYEVRCECGKTHAVGAADAGTSLHCACGRTVDVPPLHQLRTQAGEAGVSPVVQLQAMLLQGELPGTQDCACCHTRTDHLIRVSVVCERMITKGRISPGALLVGCLLFGWVGLIWAWAFSRMYPEVQHGQNVSFVLPVRVCEACAHDQSPATLRKDLAATPIYAALLERYPNADVSRLG